MKKSLIIAISIVVILVIGVGVYAMYVRSSDRSSQDGKDSKTTVRQDSAKKPSSEKKLPRNDIPIFPDGEIRYVVDTETGFSAGVKLSESVNSKEVLQYYLDTLPDNGWELEDDNVFISLTVKGHKDGKDLFVIMSSGVDKEGYWTYVIEVK